MSGGIDAASSYHRLILTEFMKNPTTYTNVPRFCFDNNRQNYNGFDVTDNKTNDIIYCTANKQQQQHHHQQQQQHQPIIIMNDNFHREDERLKTFENWPLNWLNKKELAQTGMFYTGDDDKVKCYFCEVEIGRWEREDQPVPEHLRWSPNCPLLRRRTTNNVPINADELNHLLPPISYDVCGTHDSFEAVRQNVYAEYPEYAIEASRERSFTDWPQNMKQTPAQMAEAGFFHSGSGDRVKCFSCGGGLKDWDYTDEPWEQHALWLPKCRFLKLMKGQNFIDAIIAKQKQQQNDDYENPNCSNINATQQQQQQTLLPSTSPAATSTASVQVSDTNTIATAATTPSTNQNQKLPAINDAATLNTTAEQSMPIATSTEDTEKQQKNATSIRSSSNNTTTTNNNYNHNNIPEEKLCKICYTNEYNTAFLPCGHVVACAKCASSVTKCPMCRKHFTDIMRVYFS